MSVPAKVLDGGLGEVGVPMVEADLLTPEMHVERAVKAAMNRAAKASGLSREQIVDRMIELAGRHQIPLTIGNTRQLNVETLNKWLNVNDPRRPSILVLPVFCRVVGSLAPLSAMAAPLGGQVITGQQVAALAWAENEIALRRCKKQKKRLEAQVL